MDRAMKVLDLIGDEVDFDPRLEWGGMPEFIQKKKNPFKKCSIFVENDSSVIFIRFETINDFRAWNPLANYYDGNDFYIGSRELLGSKLGQKITSKTKSIWHPFKSHWGLEKKVYVDES
jgi:hypothetical protein